MQSVTFGVLRRLELPQQVELSSRAERILAHYERRWQWAEAQSFATRGLMEKLCDRAIHDLAGRSGGKCNDLDRQVRL